MDKRIERAYEIIKREYQSKLRLADLAKKLKLSPFYFQRLFKKETGMSPLQFLNQFRLERSAHLMRSSPDRAISEIASECGFSSLSAYSRAFSDRFGMSPQVFARGSNNAIRLVIKDPPTLDVKIVYQPDTYIYYNVTSIANPKMTREFDNARSSCDLNKIRTNERNIGIGTYVTFHYPEDERNYYAGVEVKGNVPGKFQERVFFIPKGKYACFTSEEPINRVRENMMWFKISWLDKSDYLRRDLFSFEEFDPQVKASDYPTFKRKVFVPIKHK